MTQPRNIRQTVQHLGNPNLIAVYLLDSKIASRKCALQTILDGCRLYNFIDVCFVDDIHVVVGGAPRTRIDFLDYLFRHIFNELIEIVSKQVV